MKKVIEIARGRFVPSEAKWLKSEDKVIGYERADHDMLPDTPMYRTFDIYEVEDEHQTPPIVFVYEEKIKKLEHELEDTNMLLGRILSLPENKEEEVETLVMWTARQSGVPPHYRHSRSEDIKVVKKEDYKLLEEAYNRARNWIRDLEALAEDVSKQEAYSSESQLEGIRFRNRAALKVVKYRKNPSQECP